jgi:hypothetical protein
MSPVDDSTQPTKVQTAGSKEAVRPVGDPPGDIARPAASAAPAFHSDDVEHVANYQSISVLALISLLFGLASPLCFFTKGFLLLPLVGLAFSLLALRQIALSEGRLAGRWPAVIGLVLCVACGAGAITRNSTTRFLRTSKAEQFARKWLMQVASNELEEAFRLTLDGARPPAPQEPGAPAPAKSPYEMFVEDPLIQKIKSAGKDARIELDETLDFIPLTRREVIVRQRFRITPGNGSTKAGAAEAFEVYLTLQRSHFPGKSETHWLVMRYDPTNTPAN